MHALRLRTQTQITQICAKTHARTQVRCVASLRDRQLAHRRQLQKQREEAREQEQRELELQPAPATDIPEQRYAVTKFNPNSVNTGSVKIAPLDVVQSGQARDFKWSIQGQENQIVEIHLNPNASVVAETGAMLEIAEGVDMETKAGGGVMQNFKQMFGNQGVFLTAFVNNRPAGAGRAVFSSPYPSKVIALDLQSLGGALLCQKNSFLVGSNTVAIEPAFSKNFSSGFFGGGGFMLQQIHGEGTAFVQAGGAVIKRVLAPGEVIKVNTGSIVAFQPSIEYDIQLIRNVKTTVFGGEGVFMATLRGPGLVILQSLPMDRLAGVVASRANPNAAALVTSGNFQNGQLAQTGSGPAGSAVAQPASSGGFMQGGLGQTIAGGLAAGVAAGAVSGAMHHMLGGHGNNNNNSNNDNNTNTPPPATEPAADDYNQQQQPAGYDNYDNNNDNSGGWGNDSGNDDGGGWGDDGGDFGDE